MDRIRRALDLARIERARVTDLPPLEPSHLETPPATDSSASSPSAEITAAPAANGPPSKIAYAFTRVFTPTVDHLERNRVFPPGSPEPAAFAFRMLRTQVLQRMDANAWRTLAFFSPGTTVIWKATDA